MEYSISVIISWHRLIYVYISAEPCKLISDEVLIDWLLRQELVWMIQPQLLKVPGGQLPTPSTWQTMGGKVWVMFTFITAVSIPCHFMSPKWEIIACSFMAEILNRTEILVGPLVAACFSSNGWPLACVNVTLLMKVSGRSRSPEKRRGQCYCRMCAQPCLESPTSAKVPNI